MRFAGLASLVGGGIKGDVSRTLSTATNATSSVTSDLAAAPEAVTPPAAKRAETTGTSTEKDHFGSGHPSGRSHYGH